MNIFHVKGKNFTNAKTEIGEDLPDRILKFKDSTMQFTDLQCDLRYAALLYLWKMIGFLAE